jgi:hypothetical protein
MNFTNVKNTIKNAFNATFGPGAYETRLGSRQDGAIPMAEASALILAAQPQPAAPAASVDAQAPSAIFERLDKLAGDLEASRTTIATLQAAKGDLEMKLAAAQTQIDNFNQKLESAASRRAVDIVASAGLPRPVVISQADSAPTSTAQVFEQFNSIKDPRERARYFAAHKAQLLSV